MRELWEEIMRAKIGVLSLALLVPNASKTRLNSPIFARMISSQSWPIVGAKADAVQGYGLPQ